MRGSLRQGAPKLPRRGRTRRSLLLAVNDAYRWSRSVTASYRESVARIPEDRLLMIRIFQNHQLEIRRGRISEVIGSLSDYPMQQDVAIAGARIRSLCPSLAFLRPKVRRCRCLRRRPAFLSPRDVSRLASALFAFRLHSQLTGCISCNPCRPLRQWISPFIATTAATRSPALFPTCAAAKDGES